MVIFLFLTFAAFFDSLPRNPYDRSSIETPETANKDDALKGAVGQVPAHGQAPTYTLHTAAAPAHTPTHTSTHTSTPTSTHTSFAAEHSPGASKVDKEKDRISKEEKKIAEEKARAERFRLREEEKKKIVEATKVSKLVSFSVPDDIKYDPNGPRPDQIILLCASDGKGHNGGIQNLIEQTRENRQAYADLHGYKYHFLNISKYDIAPAHPVWAKLPAIAETFETYPEAQWVWWLDLDAIVMSPSVDLNKLLLSHEALGAQLLKEEKINHSGGGVLTLKESNVKNIDIIFSQDQNGINAGSFFIRRSEWSRVFLDMWADPLFVMRDWEGQEQDAVVSTLAPRLRVLMRNYN